MTPPSPEPSAPAEAPTEAPAAPAEAVNSNRFSLTAFADSTSFEIQNAKLPANIFVQGSPISSFAQVDSAGQSQAFAGLPYFGPSVQTLPGTANGLSGGAIPPIPPIPGFVESRFPSAPTASESQPGYNLKAASTATKSTSSASAGFSADADDDRPQGYSTSSTVANADGSVVSDASAGVTGLVAGPLKILDVSSREKITETGDGKPKLESRTDLGTIEVAGIKLGLSEKGFEVVGNAVPIPIPAALDAVNRALAAGNVEITYVPRKVVRDTVNGVTTVTSASLRVKTLQDVPAQGPTTVIYQYARVGVSSSSSAFGSDGAGATGGSPTTPTDTPVEAPVAEAPPLEAPTAPDVPVDDTVAEPVVADEPATPADSFDDATSAAPPAPPADSGAAPEVAGAGDSGGSDAAAPVLSLGRAVSGERGDGTLIYLVLVLGGAATFVGQQLFSRFGVRLLMRA